MEKCDNCGEINLYHLIQLCNNFYKTESRRIMFKVKQSVNPKYDARGALAAAADFATHDLLPIKVLHILTANHNLEPLGGRVQIP